MSSGFISWLRHHHVPAAVGSSILTAVILRFLVFLIDLQAGGTTDIAPMWVAMGTSIPLLFIATSQTDIDAIAPRSLTTRRTILIGGSIVFTGLLSLTLFPGRPDDAAMAWRDSLGLYGLGLLSLTFLPIRVIWVLPTVAGFASWMFGWPLYPTVGHGLWGALRAPATLHFNGGAPNLSILICGILLIAGVVTYCCDVGLHPGAHSQVARAHRRGSGIMSASLVWPTMLILAIPMVLSLGSAWSTWAGAPRILLSSQIPAVRHFWLPCAGAAGVIAGQTRWRTGVAVWEDLGVRSVSARLVRPSLHAILMAVAPALVIVLVALTASAAAMGHQRIAGHVVATEIVDGMGPSLTLLLAMAVIAVISAIVGSVVRYVWMVPFVAILSAFLALPLNVLGGSDIEAIDEQMAQRYPTLICQHSTDKGIEVCTREPNRAYLPAAVLTLEQARTGSAHPDAWPQRFVLDNAGTLGGMAPGSAAPHTALPDLSLKDSRGYAPPQSLHNDYLESVAYSTAAWCPKASQEDVLTIMGVAGSGPSAESPTMDTSLTALRACRARG